MAKITPMAPDSAAFKVLSRLYDLEGTAFISQLTEVLWAEYRSPTRFAQLVTKPLTLRGLVAAGQRGAMMMTDEGRLLVETYRRSVAAPRTVPMNTKPLDLSKHMRWGETRPGALDYRKAPSLMGGVYVPYGGNRGGSTE